jgi:hydrogenase maturation protein HypF
MRPFVYRLAHLHGISGWVVNSSRGVIIEAEAPDEDLDAFARALEEEAPPLARIGSVERETIEPRGFSGFEIRKSHSEEEESTLICPDVAICPDCLAEFLNPSDRRHHYPFINCTNCGPRYSIIEGTPYDRPKTSMKHFRMCDRCQHEYDDPLDRRFHAQPNACGACGPKLDLALPVDPADGTTELVLGRSYARMPEDVAAAAEGDPVVAARWLLKKGAIIGVRGLGGFHIAANAGIDSTVRALREKKDRPAKPFAIMCRNIDVVRELAHVNALEEEALESPWSPIVLLRKKEIGEGGEGVADARRISPAIAPRNSYLGVMLPYAPVHHLLFDDLEVLIMTSANEAGEPIVSDVAEARERLPGITRTFLDHDRDIVNRNDDSIVFVEAGHLMMSRRSRGYAPYPIELGIETREVLACGTELKNTFTLLRDGWAFVSPHVGDLANQATLEFYEETVDKFMDWFRVSPTVVAHDLHPDYLATRYAKRFGARHDAAVELVGVQHHHAHIASVMLENGVKEPVIGLALDGTGYGTDGAIWGCEFLLADSLDFERAGYLNYVPLPGGDAAIRHPYRVALSHLHAAGVAAGGDLTELGRTLFPDVPEGELDLVVQQVEKRVNCIDTSSAGRLFDAVSAMIGVCSEISYEAQAAIELESLIERPSDSVYPFGLAEVDGRLVVDAAPIVRAVLDDVRAGAERRDISAAFHGTVVRFCRDVAARLSEARRIKHVALAGGVFQNRFLLRSLVGALEEDGLTVLLHKEVPTNDGGVSLGQAAVANARTLAGWTTSG